MAKKVEKASLLGGGIKTKGLGKLLLTIAKKVLPKIIEKYFWERLTDWIDELQTSKVSGLSEFLKSKGVNPNQAEEMEKITQDWIDQGQKIGLPLIFGFLSRK